MVQTEISQCQAIKKYMASSFVDEYSNIHIILDRKTFIKEIFGIVISQGVSYGQKQETQQSSILIKCSFVDDEFTVGQLRNILLSNHIAQVLKESRYGGLGFLGRIFVDLIQIVSLTSFRLYHPYNILLPARSYTTLDEVTTILLYWTSAFNE